MEATGDYDPIMSSSFQGQHGSFGSGNWFSKRNVVSDK